MRLRSELQVTDPSGGASAMGTFTCGHGNEVVVVRPGQDPSELGGFCRMCMKHLCATCAAKGKCVPFEKKMEMMERRDRLRRACG
jgi:hypothetical protein